jgi:hypothetical protein
MRCVVHVCGPGMRVKPAPDGFVVGSEEIPGAEFVAQTLVEARLPVTDIRATTDPLVLGLLGTPPHQPPRLSGAERLCCGVVAVLEVGQPLLDLVEVGEVVGCDDFPLHDGEVDLYLVRQEAWTGVWTMTAFGDRRASRSMAFCPRWEEPLSTIQNTRFAEV